MGEIADLILDGILCEQCGTIIELDRLTKKVVGVGYPRKCEDCSEEE
jgi:hypothetical protein